MKSIPDATLLRYQLSACCSALVIAWSNHAIACSILSCGQCEETLMVMPSEAAPDFFKVLAE